MVNVEISSGLQKVIVSIIAIVFLIVASFVFFVSKERVQNEDNAQIENPIYEILSSIGVQNVSLEGTVIRVGNYVWLEEGAWTIRIINDSDVRDNFTFSLGDRINVEGVSWKYLTGHPIVNISSTEVLSRDFPINPINVNNPTSYSNRFVKVKNQKLLNYSTYVGRDQPFWLIGFDTYYVLIPKYYVNIPIIEQESYDIVGIVHFDGTAVWGLNLTTTH